MLATFIGFLVGLFAGVILTAILTVASHDDDINGRD